MQLSQRDVFNPGSSFYISFFYSMKQVMTELHSHDFYEIFIVLLGNSIHHVNGESTRLTKGMLVLVRPDDIHAYEKIENLEIQFVNFAFRKEIFEAAVDYLGSDTSKEALLESAFPPTLLIGEKLKEQLYGRMETLNSIPEHESLCKEIELRLLVMELLAEFFRGIHPDSREILPEWIKDVMLEMRKKENFSLGLPALKSLAMKSHEHICREFRRFLNVSPSAYINELRIDYAANLLKHTDMEVTQICYESGFGNLSHFNHRFKEIVGKTPKEYRDSTRKLVIP